MVDVLYQDPTAIAARFLAARRAAEGLTGYPGDLPATLEEAYRIQDEAIAAWGQRVIGWKVGRILPPLSGHFGTDRLAGPIFASRDTADAHEPSMPVFAHGFAAAEAEYLLRIGHAPEPGQRHFSLGEAADLIDEVRVGIEIASSPLATINDLGPVAVISDFGNNNGLVLGRPVAGWRTSGFEEWGVATVVDGTIVGRGRASSFPAGAIGAARFLFELMADRGVSLEPGQWISSGAVTGVHGVRPGQHVEACFGDALTVCCSVEAARPEPY